MTADPFFETIHDSQWNACVGVQGSALNYVDGYLGLRLDQSQKAMAVASATAERKLAASLS